ncbi:MAG: acyltransferase family protein [Bacteroidetes bacterium]|nr:acyltransferase family protein [Bacteroidota bacterium]
MSERKYFIDWIRVLAFFLLILFHCAMPFVIFEWEIKNKEQSFALSCVIWWLHQWRLPLLFFVSGVGIRFSLQKRSIASFAGERVVRLFIPLAFAMLFTIPLQVYFEWMQKGKINESYWTFYPSVWKFIPYPDGSLTWSHMWFVVYLFAFCILLLPVFALFKIPVLKRLKEKLAILLSRPGLILLLFFPLTIYYWKLYTKYPEQQNLVDDWFVFIFSITLLLYGYLLSSSDRFWETCEKYRKLFLSIAASCMVLLFIFYWGKLNLPKQSGTSLTWYGVLDGLHIWTLILAIAGFAKRYLNYSNAFLRYANEAVYPFYILHQTLIVAMGYYVVQWQIPIILKLVLLVIFCFASLLLLYHFFIRRFLLTRLLYGLKLRKSKDKKKAPAEGAPI